MRWPHILSIIVLLILVAVLPCSAPAADLPPPVQVALETSEGRIIIALDRDRAPRTVANFLGYVREGFYDGTLFHRVIPGFMIQGGGFTADMRKKKTRAPIANEAANGLANRRGTIAMARTSRPHSATAQFFINLTDNAFLNHRSPDPRGWGYCVFGRVTSGMEVVDAIAQTPTRTMGRMENVPATPVVIHKAVLRPSPTADPAEKEGEE